MRAVEAKRLISAAVAALVIFGGSGALGQTRAPAEACVEKLNTFLSGGGHDDVAGDLEWFATYCDPDVHERAVNAVADATMDAALDSAKEDSRATGRQIKAAMAEAHHAAAAAAAADILTSLPVPAPGPVVVVGAGPVSVSRIRPPPPTQRERPQGAVPQP